MARKFSSGSSIKIEANNGWLSNDWQKSQGVIFGHHNNYDPANDTAVTLFADLRGKILPVFDTVMTPFNLMKSTTYIRVLAEVDGKTAVFKFHESEVKNCTIRNLFGIKPPEVL